MAAHQAPPTLGFSKQKYWSGLPLPSPMHESEVAQLCLTLCNPMDCSLPGSSAHEIFQARVLEWGAIAFSREILRVRNSLLILWHCPRGRIYARVSLIFSYLFQYGYFLSCPMYRSHTNSFWTFSQMVLIYKYIW